MSSDLTTQGGTTPPRVLIVGGGSRARAVVRALARTLGTAVVTVESDPRAAALDAEAHSLQRLAANMRARIHRDDRPTTHGPRRSRNARRIW